MLYKTVTFEKPDKSKYNCERDEQGKRKCPPINMGYGCYGDCTDCFHKFEKLYENLKSAEFDTVMLESTV